MILYRSPTVIVDAHEWHIVVRKMWGKVVVTHRWRPLSARRLPWAPMVKWKGPRPKGYGDKMWKFRTHVRAAVESEGAREAAVAGLRSVTGAMLRNQVAA